MRFAFSKKLGLAAAATAALSLPVMAAPGAHAARPAQAAKANVSILWFMRVDPKENPWEKAEVAGFEKLHPNIHINLVTAPNPNGAFDAKFNALIQAGTPADIWSHLGQAGFADYYHRGLLLNLDPLVKSSHYSFGSTPMNLVNTYRKPSGLYGIPSITLDSYLFYNKDIFDAYNKMHPNAKLAYPPVNWRDTNWTWAKMTDDAKKLTGLTVNGTKTYGVLPNLFPFMGYAWQAGSDMFAPKSYVTGAPTSINLTNSKTVGIFQDMQNFFKQKIAPPYSSVKQIGNTGADPFQYGNIAMETTGGWDFRNLLGVKFHWAAAAMPWLVTNRDTLFTDPYMVAKASKHPMEDMEVHPVPDQRAVHVRLRQGCRLHARQPTVPGPMVQPVLQDHRPVGRGSTDTGQRRPYVRDRVAESPDRQLQPDPQRHGTLHGQDLLRPGLGRVHPVAGAECDQRHPAAE